MADNRMYLIHRPTRLGVMLAKNAFGGWGSPVDQDKLQEFFEYIEEDPKNWKGNGLSDFDLFLESKDSEWNYSAEKNEAGFMVFCRKEEVSRETLEESA